MTRHFRLIFLATGIASAARAQGAPLTPHQQLARDVYKQLVEINTTDDTSGSNTRAAEAMAARFRAAGFPAADVQVLVPPGRPTKGNLVVRYRGRPNANAKPVMLLAHLDVVAARREEWPRDPFILHEENGYFLGRGTSDDKAMAAMFVANLLRMKRENVVPDRDLILALTADEEGGAPPNGVEWLIANHKSLIDAAYVINEGGGGTLAGSKPIFHSVQAAEKVPVHYTLTVLNTGGHSSVPRPDNAIYALADALGRIARAPFPIALNPITKEFFAQTAKVEPDAAFAAAMRALTANPNDAGAAATLARDARYNSMMRTTCVATRIEGGHANNALPQTAKANVNCRIVPTSNANEVLADLRRIVNDTSVRIEWTGNLNERFGAAPSAVEPALMAATTDLTKKMFGDIPIIPTMSTGATDGRFLRAAGIPTYGVSGIFSVPGETNAHGRDEKLRVKSFYDGLEFLDQLVRRLTGSPRM
jgi:acetylornithine deacetylase/succinyl-diaminopimelate desuccinylase-like protein